MHLTSLPSTHKTNCLRITKTIAAIILSMYFKCNKESSRQAQVREQNQKKNYIIEKLYNNQLIANIV